MLILNSSKTNTPEPSLNKLIVILNKDLKDNISIMPDRITCDAQKISPYSEDATDTKNMFEIY